MSAVERAITRHLRVHQRVIQAFLGHQGVVRPHFRDRPVLPAHVTHSGNRGLQARGLRRMGRTLATGGTHTHTHLDIGDLVRRDDGGQAVRDNLPQPPAHTTAGYRNDGVSDMGQRRA